MPLTAITGLYDLVRNGKLLSEWRKAVDYALEIAKWIKGLGLSSTPGVLQSTAEPTDDEAAAMLQQLAGTGPQAVLDPATAMKLLAWLLPLIARLLGK